MQTVPQGFLNASKHIDFEHPSIVEAARSLTAGDTVSTAKRCFEYVRDTIKHSSDHRQNPVTCRASDVLAQKTGFCYAKSHLLCAFLRVHRIPAGLCYQRLRLADDGSRYCLHGLNAAFLPHVGWYRFDARGNNDQINVQFSPPIEALAFTTDLDGEYMLKEIYTHPLDEVTDCLTRYDSWSDVADNLPDLC